MDSCHVMGIDQQYQIVIDTSTSPPILLIPPQLVSVVAFTKILFDARQMSTFVPTKINHHYFVQLKRNTKTRCVYF